MVERNSPEYIKKLELAYLKLRSDNKKWDASYNGVLELNREWQKAYEALNIRFGDLKYRLGKFIHRLECLGLPASGINEQDPGNIDTKVLRTLDTAFEGFVLNLGRRLDEQVVGEELQEELKNLNQEYNKLKEISDKTKNESKEKDDKLKELVRKTNATLEEYDEQFKALEKELIEARRAQLEAVAEESKGVLEDLLGEKVELEEVAIAVESDEDILHKLNEALGKLEKVERSRRSFKASNTKYRKQLEDYTLLRKGIELLSGKGQEAIDAWLREVKSYGKGQEAIDAWLRENRD